MKLSVKKPKLEWGGAHHDKVGILYDIIEDDYELGERVNLAIYSIYHIIISLVHLLLIFDI